MFDSFRFGGRASSALPEEKSFLAPPLALHRPPPPLPTSLPCELPPLPQIRRASTDEGHRGV